MKATKKIVSIVLAIVLATAGLVVPVSAARTVPLVYVGGFCTTTLYKNFDENVDIKDAQPNAVFSEESITQLIENVAPSFLKDVVSFGIANKDYEKFAENLIPAINEFLAPVGCNPDGTSMDSTVGFYQNWEPMSVYEEDGEIEYRDGFKDVCYKYAEEYGSENVYSFQYDWRMSAMDNAVKLNEYIEHVKELSDARKVNIIAHSQGSTVVLAYLNAFGGNNVNALTFLCPAWLGTGIAGSLFNGNIHLDVYTMENYLVQLGNKSATTHLIGFMITLIADFQGGLFGEFFGDLDIVIQGLLPYLYRDTVVPYIGGMAGMWDLVPFDMYEDAKKFFYNNEEIASGDVAEALEVKVGAYKALQDGAKTVIDAAIEDGMKFYNIVGYNCQMIPLNDGPEMGDTVIETRYASGGAKCAYYLQSFDDFNNVYTQEVNDAHDHVSWDCKVDASTCMYPEYTWFIKNMQHSGEPLQVGASKLAVWLLGQKNQAEVTTDTAEHPQFMLYNTYKRKLTIMTGGKLGDLDGSTKVTVEDARIALKIASAQIEPTEAQFALGDVDEDGEITTNDAEMILYVAAGIMSF